MPRFARDPRDKSALAIDDSRQPVWREVLTLHQIAKLFQRNKHREFIDGLAIEKDWSFD
jgi:hypothetical protein